MEYPNIAREIKNIRTSNNDVRVTFQNGSSIEAVTSTEFSRGYRAHILLLDEFRLIPRDIYRQVLQPFLNIQRRPPFTKKPEYEHLVEENKEILISSAWYKNHWIWDQFKSFVNSMARGLEYAVVSFPYQLAVRHGLLSERRVQLQKSADDFDPTTWLMEMKSLFYGESDKAFFRLNDLQKNREIVRPFYPLSSVDYLNATKRRKHKASQKRQEGEVRIIGMDIALMEGQQNDTTVFYNMRLLPSTDGYERHVVYSETMSGEHAETQAIRLKQLYEDFDADYVIMDTQGNGISYLSSLLEIVGLLIVELSKEAEMPT